jgi:hypothetical protein
MHRTSVSAGDWLERSALVDSKILFKALHARRTHVGFSNFTSEDFSTKWSPRFPPNVCFVESLFLLIANAKKRLKKCIHHSTAFSALTLAPTCCENARLLVFSPTSRFFRIEREIFLERRKENPVHGNFSNIALHQNIFSASFNPISSSPDHETVFLVRLSKCIFDEKDFFGN